jgi:transcriptional regulator with XRE-family HTH domain
METMLTASQAKAIPPPLGYHEPTMRSQLGPRVMTLRKHARLYRTTMARALGVSEHLVRRVELRQTMPRIDLLIKIANLFRVSVNFLISDSDEPYPLYDPMENFIDGNNRWR